MANSRILVDINIVLDVVQQREPHYQDSAIILDIIQSKQVVGLLAAHSVTTLFYLISRFKNRKIASQAINELLNYFEIATVDQLVIHKALAWGWTDFEDAVQMAAAIESQANYLITRNPKDFINTAVPVLNPAQFIAVASTFE